jgi:hypothetical protein
MIVLAKIPEIGEPMVGFDKEAMPTDSELIFSYFVVVF